MSTQTGRLAEEAAAAFLTGKDFAILAQNWRTRWCEIDIIARNGQAVYFVEVKYRASLAWGSGLEYITQAKLKQMNFAAQFWMAQNSGANDYRLAAIALSDNPPQVTDWIDDLF